MRIKKRSGQSFLQRLSSRVEAEGLPPRLTAAYLASLLAALALGAALRGAGVLPSGSGISSAVRGACIRTWAGLRTDPRRLVLDIKQLDFEKLSAKREEALERGVLLTSPDDLVPARVRFEGKTYKGKVRLKGDWVGHLRDKKWSFRIRLKDGGAVMGMSEFSIHHPGQRNYLSEWLYHQALRREGILTPRYDFIAVTINGKDRGIYAIEEHCTEQFLESSGRRPGPILKFDEALMWEDRADRPSPTAPSRTGLDQTSVSPADVFKLQRLSRDAAAFEASRAAHGLFEGFRRGKLPAAKVLDLERYARFIALTDIFGAGHAAIWHNLRFYYDPVASRFEPVGYDGDPDSLTRHGKLGSETSWSARNLESDPGFRRAFVRAADRYIAEGWMETLLASEDEAARERLHILQREFPEVRWETETYLGNRNILRSVVHPVRGVQAFLQEAADRRVRLRVANIQRMPVELVRLGVSPQEAYPPPKPTVLSPFREKKHPEFVAVDFQLPKPLLPGKTRWDSEDIHTLGLEYRTEFSERTRLAHIVPWPFPEEALQRGGLLQRPPNAGRFPFIIRRRDPDRLVLRPGNWVLEEPLIVPSGTVLAAGPGTRLTLRGAGAVVSRSPLRFQGSRDAPVVVAAEGTGQGLLVLGAGGRSELSETRFLNLAPPRSGSWGLTGAVTFDEADVSFSGCLFKGARAEDSLNLVRSSFSLVSVVFDGAEGDALDGDFTEGSIRDTSFIDSGNDALDVSGSVIEMEGVLIRGAGDKGISAGEMSRVTGSALEIKGAGIGAASKDSSLVTLSGVTVSATRVGAAVFQKKAAFGPGKMSLDGVRLSGVETPFLVEKGSVLAVDGRLLFANSERLKSRLYP